jgi:exonuclease III
MSGCPQNVRYAIYWWQSIDGLSTNNHMKIVSWNCNGALRKKLDRLISLDADISIIQECEDPARSSDVKYQQWASNYLWIGKSKNKGLAIFAKPHIILERLNLDSDNLESFIPCKINNHTTLLAAWTRQANSPTFGYIGQLWKFLQIHKDTLASEETLLIGDLNSNACWDVWDRWWNHSDVVRELFEIGIQSLYHHQTGEPQGQETQPTFYMYRKPERPYHIDYAFLSAPLLKSSRLSIGAPSEWLEYSDHMPVIINMTSNIAN